MGKVIALANQKGGVGKTTTTFNFGAGLADKGYKVLMIDLDHQANLTLYCGIQDFDDLSNTIATAMRAVMTDSDCIDPLIYNYKEFSSGGRVDFIPSNVELAKVNLELVQVMAREFVLKRIVSSFKKLYDYILIDCAPSLSVDLINALTAADEVLIVTNPAKFSTSGTEQLVKSINKVKDNLNNDLKIAGVLFNKVDRRTILTRDIIKIMRSSWGEGIKIFETEIPASIRVDESQIMNEPMIEYEPDNKVSIGFSSFVDEYLMGGLNNGKKI